MLPKILRSSIDPTKLSSTIKGVIISLSSVVIMVASVAFHTTLDTNQVAAFADQAAQTVSAVGIAFGMIHTMYGIIIKIVHVITKNKSTSGDFDAN